MAKAEKKTKVEERPVADFIEAVPDEKQRGDARWIAKTMARLSGEQPKMWGPSIIGFGSYHYRYDSGREGDAPRIGFSPRKGNTVLYLMDGYERKAELLERLGKHKTGKACLYVKRLSDVDTGILEELIADSVAEMDQKYPRGDSGSAKGNGA